MLCGTACAVLAASGSSLIEVLYDPRYVEAVTTNPALETVFLNMDRAGVGVTLKKRT